MTLFSALVCGFFESQQVTQGQWYQQSLFSSYFKSRLYKNYIHFYIVFCGILYCKCPPGLPFYCTVAVWSLLNYPQDGSISVDFPRKPQCPMLLHEMLPSSTKTWLHDEMYFKGLMSQNV